MILRGNLLTGLVLLITCCGAWAQSTTINTQTQSSSGYSASTSAGSGGTAFITFVVENNSGGDIRLTEVGRYTTTSYNNTTSSLWYSAFSLSGSVGTLPTTGWTKIDDNTVTGITSSTVNPVNEGLTFIIPDGATYRFALQTSSTNTYSSSGSPNTFTAAGVSLYCGNYQINGNNVGYGATNNPRYFVGSITFEPACDAKIDTQPTTQSACAGDTITYSATATDAQQYQWQIYNSGVWTNLSDNFLYNGTGTTTLTVNGVSVGMANESYRMLAINTVSGCSIPSDSADIDLLGAGSSSISITSGQGTDVCANEQVAINSFFTNGGTNPHFTWYRNNVVIPGENNGVLQTSALNNGDVIYCRLVSNALCVSPKNSNKITFNVNSVIKPAVSIATTYEGNDTHTFTANPVNGGTNPRYYWEIDGVHLAGETGLTFTRQGIKPWQNVTVRMESDLSCAEPKIVQSAITTTSIASTNPEAFKFTLVPNPNTGRFVIQLDLSSVRSNEPVQIRIVDAVGRLVYERQSPNTGSATQIPVTLPAGVSNGMYMVNVSVGGDKVVSRFVLNR